MNEQSAWPLGVCIFPEVDLNKARSVNYPKYLGEIIHHAGVCHTPVKFDELESQLDNVRILLTIGERAFSSAVKTKLKSWLEAGGQWISIAGVCGMGDTIGVSLPPAYQGFGAGLRTLGEGYLEVKEKSHAVLGHITRPLHFFSGISLHASGAKVLATAQDAHGRPTETPAVLERVVGKGKVTLIAIDLTGTVVYIQQGHGITRDGVPAPDGTAPITDAVLKSGDGGVLDWIFDREPVPGIDGLQCFLNPVADQWREVLLRAIFQAAVETRTDLPLLWLYPRNLPALGTMSHDTDQNVPEYGRKLLETVNKAGIKTTWCTILPGYAKAFMDELKADGQELATHYDSMTEGLPWCKEQVDRQFNELKALFGEQPVTNKNHYLRWQGDCEFFEWCEEHGIEMDQSKGASKTGEAGYNFGTCHPYFPITFENRMLNVLELCTPTQDLGGVFAPHALFEPLLKTVLKNHGVLHLLYHPHHIEKPGVIDSILDAAKRGKDSGMEWWTGRQINSWERARRKMKWTSSGTKLQSPAALSDVTILRLSPTGSGDTKRWGFTFNAKIKHIHENEEIAV
jgi:hypothetical protein